MMLCDYFTRCIERLRDLHIASKNFTEAGFTVLKHAELLEVIITDQFQYIIILTWFRGLGEPKEVKYSSLNLDVISFVLFP